MSKITFTTDSLLPSSIEAASGLLQQGFRPICGGTDIMVRNHAFSKIGKPLTAPLFSCRNIPETRQLKISEGKLIIGSSITLSEIIEFPDCPELLKTSLLSIASPGIRNLASLAGNVCNASPAADSLPALYILDAVIETCSLSGCRKMPVSEFIQGPGKTALLQDEIMTAISFDICDLEWYFRKVGTRAANALAKLSIAAVFEKQNDRFLDFKLAIGACGPKVIRCREAEEIIKTYSSKELKKKMDEISAIYVASLAPIDDQRSTAVYRKNTALRLIKSILQTGG